MKRAPQLATTLTHLQLMVENVPLGCDRLCLDRLLVHRLPLGGGEPRRGETSLLPTVHQVVGRRAALSWLAGGGGILQEGSAV